MGGWVGGWMDVPSQLSIDGSTAGLGVLFSLKDEHPCSLSHHETSTVLVKRTGSLGWVDGWVGG